MAPVNRAGTWGLRSNIHLVDLPLEEAARRALKRYANNGRLVDVRYVLSIGDRPRRTFEELIKRKDVNGFTEWTTEVPQGTAPRLIRSGGDPDLGSGAGGERGAQKDDGNVPQAKGGGEESGAAGGRVTEQTDQGEQAVLPGGERISDRELAERQAGRPLEAGAEQRGVDGLGLFDPDGRAQSETLFDAVPIGERVDPDTGAIIPETRTVDEILSDIDAERDFLEGAEVCRR